MFERLKEYLRRKIGPGTFTYSILKPCFRCNYGKRLEPIIILSGKTMEVKMVVNYSGKTYARRGGCLGVLHCCDCLKAIDGEMELPCKWIKF